MLYLFLYLYEYYFINMEIINFKDFMKKYNLKNNTMKESQLQQIYICPIFPRDSKLFSNKEIVNIGNESQGGTHWTCFIVKDNKSKYFDSFGVQPDKFLLNQLLKPIIYHKNKIQDINSKLCGSYWLYFFYLIGRMKYYDTILKMYFE